MKFEEQFSGALAALKTDPQDRAAIGELCSSYWSWLTGSLGEIIHGDGDTTAFIEENADLIDFGIRPELVDVAEVRGKIADCDIGGCRIKVRTMTEWIKELLLKVRQGDKVEKLEHEIKLQELQHRRLEGDIADLQKERRVKVEAMYFRPADSAKPLAEVETTERLQLESIRKKKEISKGAFLSVEQKRDHVKQQMDLQKRLQFTESFVNTLPDKDAAPDVKRITKAIEELFVKVVDSEFQLKKAKEDLEDLQKKSSDMTPAEVESRITEDIEYIRDLTRLTAKRLALDPLPLVRPDDKVFSLSVMNKSLNQITEVDPHIFHNDRVPLFGRPYVLLTPGAGNGIYDWKNNCIILPVIAPGGNFMGSIATGIIEYRLDVDEDKKILTSYNQLPDLKTVRSIITLKARLVKEYIIWMTSEYNGYRILSKENKVWFEHEIGPSRNDIYTPLELQNYTMSSQEFNTLFDEVTARLKEADDSEGKIQATPEDLWVGSILLFQQGKGDKAVPYMEQLVKLQPDNKMAWYNLGFIAMKHMNRTLAKEAFGVFCKLDTQSWWSKLARDHLRACT